MNWRIIFVFLLVSVLGIVFFIAQSNRPQQRVVPTSTPVFVKAKGIASGYEVIASNDLSVVCEWLAENPGLYDEAISRFEKISQKFPDTASAKAAAELIENQKEAKQLAITKVVDTINLEAKVMEEKGLYALKGHRVVGGLRASLYNAMPFDGVECLVEFMKDFKKNNT